MKPKLYATFFIVMIAGLGLMSCKTASKMYEKGNYDEAVLLAAKKLQKDPDDAKLIGIIRNAYEYAINDHETRISNHASSSNDLRYEWMYAEYVSLQEMYEAIYKVPAIMEIVKPVDYSADVMAFREKAGQARFERGIAFMQRSDKQSYRNAYREFQAALRFLPGDVETIQQRDIAYEYAVTNVVVLPLQQNGGYVYSSYSPGSFNLDDELIRDLQHNSGSDFTRYYSAWDARAKNIRVDRELDMHFAHIDLGRISEKRTVRKVSKDVVVKEIVYKPDSIVREYKRVTAEIITTNRTMYSTATLQLTTRDIDGRRIWGDQISADHAWSTEIYTFTGDERALSDSDRELIHRRREFAPTESAIMECLVDEISNNAAYRVRSFAG